MAGIRERGKKDSAGRPATVFPYTPSEREAVMDVLRRNGGNISQTQRDTGVSRPTLIKWAERSRVGGRRQSEHTPPEKRFYSAPEKAEALGALEGEFRGSIAQASKAMNISARTLERWRAFTEGAQAGIEAPPLDVTDWVAVYAQAARKGAALLMMQLERYIDQDLSMAELYSLAKIVEVVADKHLDYRDGRRGMSVHIGDQKLLVTTEGRLQIHPDGYDPPKAYIPPPDAVTLEGEVVEIVDA